MAVQYPQLSLQEQTDRYQQLASDTLFPYSYDFSIGLASGGYARNIANVSFNFDYAQFSFLADNNIAISAIAVAVSSVILVTGDQASRSSFFVIVSYSPIPVLPTLVSTDLPVPSLPSDTGNEIFRVGWQQGAGLYGGPPPTSGSPNQFNNAYYQTYRPYNYLLKYNQYLYLTVMVDHASNTSFTGFLLGSVVFHTVQTGLKI